jgi:hypothetical protein
MSEASNAQLYDLLLRVCSALKQAADSLQVAIEGMPADGEGSVQQFFAREQARSVASVAADVGLLVSHRHFQNVTGLCRVAFESRIQLYAAMRVPEFASQKFLAQFSESTTVLEEMASAGDSSPAVQEELNHHRRLLKHWRETLRVPKERTWKIKEAAEAAGLLPDFQQFYSTLSKAAHSTLMGLTSKDHPLTLATSVLRLLHDTIEALASLVFFRQRDSDAPHPQTTHWLELIEPIAKLQGQYMELLRSLHSLTGDFATLV